MGEILTNIDSLKQHFSGDIILPGDDQYQAAASIFTKAGEPALIVRPRTPADVARALQHATEATMTISVKSGGHSNAGLSTNNGGMVIDLCHFADIEIIDKEMRIVRIGSGATWGKVAEELQRHGLAISSGDTKTVGVGGLTQGGGIGWMVRQYGLTIDSLVAAEIVVADGSIIHASADEPESAELFWAIRGGAGNMGVVTHFEFMTHPVSNVYFGPLTYNLDNVDKLLKGWRDYMRIAPVELTTSFLAMPSFMGNDPMAIILCCYNGDDKAKAEEAIAPLRALAPVIADGVEEMPYAHVLEEAHPPQGMRAIVRNTFMHEFTDEAIDVITKYSDHIFMIRSVRGAMNEVPADATAFAHRDNEAMIVAPAFVQADASDAEVKEAMKAWEELKALGKGSYIGFSSDATDEEVHRAFPPETYARLTTIKQRYDPGNIFNQNYNVKPLP